MTKPTLQEKQMQIEEEHFAEVEQDLIESHDQQFINRAYDVRGALRAVGAIAEDLMSQHIRGLMLIESEKLWRGLGYASFADFLTNDPAVKPSKSGYYDQREVLLNSSDLVLDAITGKVSVKKVKALLAGGIEMSVEDGRLTIGDESVEVGDARAISNIVEGFHQTLVERDAREEKLQKDLEKAADKNRIGESENNNLRRELDELRANVNPLGDAVAGLFAAFDKLCRMLGDTADDEKTARKTDDLKLFAAQYFRLQDAYGSDGGHVPLARPSDGEMDTINRAIAEMDMEDLD